MSKKSVCHGYQNDYVIPLFYCLLLSECPLVVLQLITQVKVYFFDVLVYLYYI